MKSGKRVLGWKRLWNPLPEYFHKFSNAVIRKFYKLYFLHILPAIGCAVSGNKSAYKYLPASVLDFPEPDKFIPMM
ncbi:MAG: class I SAM-dependent methyltransferase [Bacteroidales bacterium]|nr:class I SAM-dependent methyltransferase [Bacteroidales bacterium]